MTHQVHLSIPESLAEEARKLHAPTPEERMEAVISWSIENVKRGEGPFAAGVFQLDTGQCVAAGVNCVLSSGFSIAHAEIMAILMAQTTIGSVDLSRNGPMVITSSAQPCSQCMGAIPWTGLSCLEYGADRETVQAIGFDEGPCPENWKQEYKQRGIEVIGPLLQDKAAEVIRSYADQHGSIY